jgi:hypothetical protein
MKQHGKLGRIYFSEIIASLLEWQPNAVEIRRSGDCPSCGVDAEVSYILLGELSSMAGDDMEDCGYYCGYCGWGNAGSRERDDL